MSIHAYFPGGPMPVPPSTIRVTIEKVPEGYRLTRQNCAPQPFATKFELDAEVLKLNAEAEKLGGLLEIANYTADQPKGVILKEQADV